MNKRNPNNSSVIQMTLDGLTNAKADNLDDVVTVLTALEKVAKAHPAWLSKTDKLYEKHKYPNSKIKYAKADISCDIESFLSPDACKLLNIAYKHMSQENLVELKRSIVCDRYNMTIYAFSNAIKELSEEDIISKVINRNKEHGVIYKVNEKYYTKGKLNPLGNEKATLLSDPDEVKDNVAYPNYHTMHTDDGFYITYGSIPDV